MTHHVLRLLHLIWKSALTALRLFMEGWRLWLMFTLIGGIVGGLLYLGLPPRYTSTAILSLSPRQPLEGYLLATQELTRHYAVRLVAPARVDRAVALAQSDAPLTIQATGAGGMQVQLSVTHSDPHAAETIAAHLLNDFEREITAENRTRIEPDWLQLQASRPSFAKSAWPAWWLYVLVGATVGWAVGMVWLYGQAWYRHGRVLRAQEAEALTGVPTLGIIPRL